GRNTLVHDRSIGIRKDVIDGKELDGRAEEHVVANPDAALAAHDGALADEGPAAQSNAGLRHIAKVEHVQARAVHDPGSRANVNAARAAMQVDAVVQVHTRAEPDVL